MAATETINSAANQISQLQGIAQANSAFNAEQARIQREWSEQQSAKAMEFNANEAAKNRDWQEMMANTAHQREVKDLMAAGLNPVLSAMNGNGAAVTSGATASGVVGSGSKADADTSTSGAIANLLGSILSADTAIRNADVNARTQEAVADKYNAMSEIVANINAAAGIQQAGIHAGATRYAADSSKAASMFASQNAYSASKYASDQSRASSKYSSDSSYYSARDNSGSVFVQGRNFLDNVIDTVGGILSGDLKSNGGNFRYDGSVSSYKDRSSGSGFRRSSGAGRK